MSRFEALESHLDGFHHGEVEFQIFGGFEGRLHKPAVLGRQRFSEEQLHF